MEAIVIRGARKLHGEVTPEGSKYSGLAAIPAALLSRSPVTITNLPQISDVTAYLEIIQSLGAKVSRADGATTIDASGISESTPERHLVKKMRASYYLLGALLARTGQARVAYPGGDKIGPRPMDIHLKGLRAMGAELEVVEDEIIARVSQLKGATIYCDVPSVGATFNLMIAAVNARGRTNIVNAYRAPWIVDLANMLNAQGARITGAGTETITIEGVDTLDGCVHTLIPDHSQAATYIIAVAIAGGRVKINDVDPAHMVALLCKLEEAGVTCERHEGSITIVADGRPNATNITTAPYPGFYTDYQPLTAAWLARARGASTITETVWPERFAFVDGLRQMGARIRTRDNQATISGVRELHGVTYAAGDLRAAASVILAGLGAHGTTVVTGLDHLDRGYADLAGQLAMLGADVQRQAVIEISARETVS